MAFILDASVAVAWVVARQATTYSRAIRLRAKREPYHAPALWRVEVVNVINALVRRQSLSAEAGRTATDILDRLQPVPCPVRISIRSLIAPKPRNGRERNWGIAS